MSQMQDLMNELRKTPFFRQIVPMEAQIGWPIPLRKAGKVYVTLPFFSISTKQAQGPKDLYPPFAIITVDWANHRLVEYVNLHFRNPWPEGNWNDPVGTFPHPAVAQMSVAAYRETRSRLLALYDELLEMLAQNQSIPAAWSADFSERLRLLVEPPLEPYYRALGPKFFERYLPTGRQISPVQ